ncbi:hypothetical protein ACTFIY_000008 [Dictyostelium cf. discoideum]
MVEEEFKNLKEESITKQFEIEVPMSNTSEIIDRTKKSKYYSIINAKRGFHLLNLKSCCRKFTAFRVGSKLYQFNRAAFGLKNSPAYFNRSKDHLKLWLGTIRKRDYVIEIKELCYLIDSKTDCKRLIIIDKNQITMVLEEAHSTSYSGHIANYKLGYKLRKSFLFSKFWDRINKFVAQCHECQKNRILKEKHGQLKSLSIPAQP